MTPAFLSVFPGAVVDAHGDQYLVINFAGADRVLARSLTHNREETLSFAEIEISSINPSSEVPTQSRPDLSTISSEQWEAAIDAYQAIRPLLEAKTRTGQIAKEAAESIGVSRATIYRWVKRFEETGTITGLMHKRRSDIGASRFSEAVEQIIISVIHDEYLKKQRRNIRQAYEKLKNRLKAHKHPAVHYSTFKRRIHGIAPEIVALSRDGENAALRYRPIKGSIPNADFPYAIIQIDHTPADLILVDEVHRTPIGRPWITLAIDVYSRMVVGWYISLDPPGDLSTGICISNTILPKLPLVANLGIDFPWPCQGKPSVIHADNAKEFRGRTLEYACQEHLIDLQFRKLRKPRYGSHIETYLGTLGERIHSLPGTTFSNAQQRGEYESEKEAAMTLSEFEQWLGNLILGQYHHEIHSSIGMPPIEKYRQGIIGDGTQIGVGFIPLAKDHDQLRIDFLPFEERTVQAYGIQIDNIYYYSDVLRRWIGAKNDSPGRSKRKFIVRRDPRNISSIIFYDPEIRQYFPIPYRDASRPAISLWELHAAQSFLKKQGKAAEDEDTIFRALESMWLIEETSTKLTMKARRKKERNRLHGMAPPLLPGAGVFESSGTGATKPSSISPASKFDRSKLKPFDET